VRRPLVLLLALVAIGAAAASARVALAYTLIGPEWPSGSATYDRHTLSVNWKSVAGFGADQWTNVPTSSFVWTSDDASNNDIFTGSIDGKYGTLAITTIYYSGSTITKITIKFDSAEKWYLGAGQPGGSQIDGRSVSAHEFGHGIGVGHSQSGYCPMNPNRATMCGAYPVGTSYMRSLEQDDKNAAAALYP
jgi:hypothetical protein